MFSRFKKLEGDSAPVAVKAQPMPAASMQGGGGQFARPHPHDGVRCTARARRAAACSLHGPFGSRPSGGAIGSPNAA